MGKEVRDLQGRYTSFKAKVRHFFSRLWFFTKVGVVVALIAVIAYSYGVADKGNTVYAQNIIVATTTQQEAPVLQRIADCESGSGKPGSGTHYKNGQVVLKANTNGTIDIGKYQVNLTYWGKKASELGYDLTKEDDNYKMAKWIYENKGTSDWSASQHCWYR